ncbi:MAG: hypothetical protein WCK67_11775 [bacterium]
MSSFYENVSKNAYYNYLNRIQNNLPVNSFDDWISAEKNQIIIERIKEEAFLHSKVYGEDDLINWITAEKEINERLRFLAYYLHESNINKSAVDNWKEAEKVYIEQF